MESHKPRIGKKTPGPSVKDPGLYEELREDGASKEKAARIANAAASSSRSAVGKKGGESRSYDDWNVEDLRARARVPDMLSKGMAAVASVGHHPPGHAGQAG